MNPLQRMNIEEWIGALRGGSYRQTSHALHRGDSFCALGVLADIQGVDWEETRKEYSEPRGLVPLYGFRANCNLPEEIVWDGTIPVTLWQAWTGLPRVWAEQVADMNDDRDYTFEDIADSLKEATAAIGDQVSEGKWTDQSNDLYQDFCDT
jgi:hypothetical protein